MTNAHSEPEHTYGCAFKQRGGVCDCDVSWWDPSGVIGEVIYPQMQAALDREFAKLGIDLSNVEATRGIDYSRYTAAEGINEGDDE